MMRMIFPEYLQAVSYTHLDVYKRQTIDGEMPRYSNYEWTDLSTGETILGLANVHCVVLTALGETKCVLADPLDGERVLEKEEFEQMFSAMGCRAVVIHD